MPRQVFDMTPLEFFELTQNRAQRMNPDHMKYILDQPEHLVSFLLSINDGFRGLAAYCLSLEYDNNHS